MFVVVFRPGPKDRAAWLFIYLFIYLLFISYLGETSQWNTLFFRGAQLSIFFPCKVQYVELRFWSMRPIPL